MAEPDEDRRSVKDNIFQCVDQCDALLEQVPPTFFLGTTVVGLTCMHLSRNYFAFGTDCGALFLFNRRLNRSVNPLRTNYDQVAACVRLFSGDCDMLAVGHKCGSMALIRFPTARPGVRRKMEQTMQSEPHKGHEVTAIEWASDGSKVFSADDAGVVVVTDVDFDKDVFRSHFVCCESSSVYQISYAADRLAVCSSKRAVLIDISTECNLAYLESSCIDFSREKVGVALEFGASKPTLLVCSSNGVICEYDAIGATIRRTTDFANQVNQFLDQSESVVHENGEMSEPNLPDDDHGRFPLHKVYSLNGSYYLVFFRSCFVVLRKSDDDFRVSAVLSFKDAGLDEHSVIDVAVEARGTCSEVFVLTNDKRVIRLCATPAPEYLTKARVMDEEFSPRTLLSSIHKTTKLLPYVPTSAIINRFKPIGDHSLVNLPNLPILNNIFRFAMESSYMKSESPSCRDDSSASESEESNVLEVQCSSSESFDSPADDPETLRPDKRQQNGDLLEVKTVDDVESFTMEPTDPGPQQPNRLIANVNQMAKKVVDAVGGIGTLVEDGYFALDAPAVDDACIPLADSFPIEQFGVLEEVTVHRTKRAPGRRRRADEFPEQFASATGNSIPSCSDEVPSIDNETLLSIRQVLTGSPTLERTSQSETRLGELYAEAECSRSDQNEKVQAVVPNEKLLTRRRRSVSESNIQLLELSRPAETGFGHDVSAFESVAASVTLSAASEGVCGEEEESESSAYERLMKKALKNKPTQFVSLEEKLETFHYDFSEDNAIVNDRGDVWNELNLPFSCCSFSVSSQYIIVCHAKRKKSPRLLRLPDVGEQWTPLKYDADAMVTNDSGSLVWRVHKGIAYSPVSEWATAFATNAPPAWTVAANEGGGIVEVCLTQDAAWYITKNDEVYVQLKLPEMGILSRCESPWPLRSITASEVAVWALRRDTGCLVVRAGLKHCPVGIDWVEIEPEGPAQLTSVCLFGQSGWAIDTNHSLWFTNGVDFQSPFGTSGAWLQVCCPWDVSPDAGRVRGSSFSVKVSSMGVFVCTGRKVFWAVSASPVSGHRFKRVVPLKLAIDDCFELISSGNATYDKLESICLCRKNEIFLYRLRGRNFYSLPAVPSSYISSVRQVCSQGGYLFVLDSSGCIHVKKGLCGVTPFGAEWTPLNTGECGSPVVSFAVSVRSIWVITANSNIFVVDLRGNLDSCADSGPVNWKNVKLPSSDSAVDQIRCSCSGVYVWVFSMVTGRSWARNAVSDTLPFGKSWTEASAEPGVRDLAVGQRVVWSLSESGQLYRLRGLAAGNPAGNYWKPVPGRLSAISLDPSDHLWAIDQHNRLLSHRVELYPPSFDRRLGSVGSVQRSSATSDEDDFVAF